MFEIKKTLFIVIIEFKAIDFARKNIAWPFSLLYMLFMKVMFSKIKQLASFKKLTVIKVLKNEFFSKIKPFIEIFLHSKSKNEFEFPNSQLLL